MIVYFDGSQVFTGSKSAKVNPDCVYSWGAVIHHNDETKEYAGACVRPVKYRGEHELFAFLETVLRIQELGVDPRQASYYTDDKFTAYAHFDLHLHNNRRVPRERLLGRLREVCDQFYSYDLGVLAEAVLQEARINKVKGHHRSIYNLRVDYLSRCAHKELVGTPKKAEPFEDWLAAGFSCYNDRREAFTWYAPFCSQ